MLQDIWIPRFLASGGQGPYQNSGLHNFSDASGTAYRAVAYLRKVDASSAVSTILLFAKTRVAPLALELSSVLLASAFTTTSSRTVTSALSTQHFRRIPRKHFAG